MKVAYKDGKLVIEIDCTPELVASAPVAGTGRSRTLERVPFTKVPVPFLSKPLAIMIHVSAPLAGE